MTDKDREAARRLQDAMIEDILAASDEEIVAEAAEDGLAPEREAERMRATLARAAGKARMRVAKAQLASERGQASARVPDAGGARTSAANDVGQAKKVTMAARHGKDQTERDVETTAEDLADLAAFENRQEVPDR